MKNLLSRISKKSVALLVAVALVLTSVATIVVASADTVEYYTVTAEDPVIPMTAGYRVDPANFKVTIGENTYDGDDFTWTLGDGVEATDINIVDGKIEAYERGAYTLVATLTADSSVSMKVFPIVKLASEDSYVIYENDYRDSYVYDEEKGEYVPRDYSSEFGVSIFLHSVKDKAYTDAATLDAETVDGYSDFVSFDATTNFAAQNGLNGYAPVDYWNLNKFMAENDAEKKHFNRYSLVVVLKNELLENLTNYKFTSTVQEDPTSETFSGLIGRFAQHNHTSSKSDADPNKWMAPASQTTTPWQLNNKNGTSAFVGAGIGYHNNSGIVLIGKHYHQVYYSRVGTGSTMSNEDYYKLYPTNWYNIYLNGTYVNIDTVINNQTVIFRDDKIAFTRDTTDAKFSVDAITGYNVYNKMYYQGTVGWVLYGKDDLTSKNGETATYSILDCKVELDDVVVNNAKLLPTEKILGVSPAAAKVFAGYQDIGGYTINAETGAITITGPVNKVTVTNDDIGTLTSVSATSNETLFGNRHAPIGMLDLSAATNLKTFNNYAYAALPVEVLVLPDVDGVKLNSSITQVANWTTTTGGAFEQASSLRYVDYHGRELDLAAYAFEGAVSLKKINAKIRTHSNGTFQYCHSLEEIEFVGSRVSDQACGTCRSLKKVKLAKSVTSIATYSFYECNSLYDINLPEGLTSIGNSAFRGCTSLTEITLPSTLATLGANAFTDASYSLAGLKDVYVMNPSADGQTWQSNAFKSDVTIHGFKGSYAESFANANGLAFEEIILPDDVNVPVNATVDLSKISVKVDDEEVLGANIVWDNATTENYTVVNGKLITFGKGNEFTITGTYNGVIVSKIINIVSADESDLLDNQYTSVANNENVSLVPSATKENVYNIEIAENVKVIPNSIKVSESGYEYNVLTLADTTGKSFAFETFRPEKVTITAEYTTENIEDDVFYLGSSIRFATDSKSAGIKFMNRLPAITYGGSGVTHGTIALDDGSTATVKAIGTLVIPSILLGDATLAIPEDLDFDADTTKVKLGNVAGQEAMNIKHKSVIAYSEKFSDVSAVLGGLDELGLSEEQYKTLDISAVTYIQYEKADGSIGYAYGDVQEESFADIEADMYPEYVKNTDELDVLIEGGTENDFVSNSAVNAFSYGLNEDITFKLRVKGNYKINYVLMKDNPSENLYGNESVLDASKLSYLNATNRYNSNCVVASGQFDDRIFTITTQMNQPGTVRLMVEIIGKNGEVVETANLSALADYKNITAAYDESFYVDDATVKAMYDTLRNNVDTFVANTLAPAIAANSTQITGFITAQLSNPVIGAEYTLTYGGVDLMYLQTVYSGNKAVSFNYRIATNAIVGIEANETGYLFDISEGSNYDTAADATGLPTYNLRPSSGYIAIPKDVTTGATYGILGRYQGYGGYYWNPAYSSSSVIEVGTNGTGVINSYVKNGVIDEATKNTASSALGAKTPVNGGNNNFIFDSSKTEFEDPTQLFQYGMLIRNYTALKVVELLPFFDESKDVTMRGGSMGAWQSTSMAALYTKVNVLDIDKVWMCSIGVTEAGMLKSEFNPKASKASYYFTTINAAKQIGNREGFEATIEGYLGDYTSPPAGLAALYNVLICKKSLTFNQYKNHSVQPPLGSGTKATATVSAAAQ